MSRRAGMSLLPTLLICMVVFLVASTLVALTTMNINLAENSYAENQASMLACAAVTQFISDESPTGTVAPVVTGVPGPGVSASSTLSAYVPSIDPGGGLPGTITSVSVFSDNSVGETVNNYGVPPFSVALHVTANVSGRDFTYEAILTRVWPYALTAPGEVFLGYGTAQQPGSITGGSCVFQNPLVAQDGINIAMSSPIFDQLQQLRESITLSKTAGTAAPAGLSIGIFGTDVDIVNGRIDFATNPSAILNGSTGVDVLPPGNVWQPPQAGQTFTATTNLINNVVNSVFTPDSIPDDYVDVVNKYPTMFSDISPNLMGGDFFLVEGSSLSLNSGYNVIRGTVGNVFPGFLGLVPGGSYSSGTPPDVGSGASLNLQDCILRVEGNFDWSGGPNLVPGQAGTGTVTMQNATLIVDGNLILRDINFLDAGSRGSVIYCHHLAGVAGGTIRGLIVASNGVVILPSPTGGALRIYGGLVVGGNDTQFETASADVSGAVEVEQVDQPGTLLSSVQLQYDPQWLKRLHSLGKFTLQTLRRCSSGS